MLALRALGAENLRCGAFAVSVPFVRCSRSGLWLETLRLRVAFERSGRTPKVSCSFNGTRALTVNCHYLVTGIATLLRPPIEVRCGPQWQGMNMEAR